MDEYGGVRIRPLWSQHNLYAAMQKSADSRLSSFYVSGGFAFACGRPLESETMPNFDESKIEYADFTFERMKVICYGLLNTAGGTTTILNFPTSKLAEKFREAFLRDRKFQIVQNNAQLICLADYDTVMRRSDHDPRVQQLKYNRDFMMGTLSHVV